MREIISKIASRLVRKIGRKGAKNIDHYFFNDENTTPVSSIVPDGLEGERISKVSSILNDHISSNTNFEIDDRRIVNDFNELSFSEAFSSAREIAGEGGHWFKFHDGWYNTYLKKEWDSLGKVGQEEFTTEFLQDLDEIKLGEISPILDLDWGDLGNITGSVTAPTERGNENEGVFEAFCNWLGDIIFSED